MEKGSFEEKGRGRKESYFLKNLVRDYPIVFERVLKF